MRALKEKEIIWKRFKAVDRTEVPLEEGTNNITAGELFSIILL